MFPSKMGEANENRRSSSSSKEMVNLSLQIEKYPRDLLQRFTSTEAQASKRSEGEAEEEEEKEVELNLGLSLGGRFGVDKNAKKLTRSSSIAGSIPIFREDDANTPPPVPYTTLTRTSSLPAETEEEWRKRKELQTLRRMEAKRRRSEKQRSSRERINMDVNLLGEEKQAGGRGNSIGVGPPFGLQNWAAAARQMILGGAGGGGGRGGAVFSQGSMQPCSQGSVESQGGSSSSMSEMENKGLQGASSCGEARSSGSTQSLQDQEATGSSGTKTSDTLRTPKLEVETLCKTVENRWKEQGDAMEYMPCVFTKGEGPNGKRIEGILYRYGKGEEVRIMCVCHGNFLSPAEFVKHAGGGDVDHPLRHIVVNPSSSSLL
ncbi:hypothetical protein PTKIN_Ptkin17bG0147300 [Pterospermum kingtungense]